MSEFAQQLAAFSMAIERELETGSLNFPTVLDLSLRIKRAADDPDSSLEDIAKLIRLEPVLSARVIQMANSVIFNRAGNTVTNVSTAVRRLGISNVRVTALIVAMDQLGQEHRSRSMRVRSLRRRLSFDRARPKSEREPTNRSAFRIDCERIDDFCPPAILLVGPDAAEIALLGVVDNAHARPVHGHEYEGPFHAASNRCRRDPHHDLLGRDVLALEEVVRTFKLPARRKHPRDLTARTLRRSTRDRHQPCCPADIPEVDAPEFFLGPAS